MRAIMVAVDYDDLLAITLPYNRHHFDEVWVVTARGDTACYEVARANDCKVVATNSFYAHGAVFNKWLALEEGLECMGRRGWMCLMDADVLWPKRIVALEEGSRLVWSHGVGTLAMIQSGDQLVTPLRRMMVDVVGKQLPPPEDTWGRYPVHRNVAEWAGYSQIFHAEDPHLGPSPWHEINWRHAGGADSFFQFKWPATHKVRPPFEVLHLGAAGVNWCGRATSYLDGTTPPAAEERKGQVRAFIRGRTAGRDRFHGEKIF